MSEKATGIVVRISDWSETSRIANIWTRELGKVRVLAKGGRRLKSNFEVALDLLSVCSIVLIRSRSGGLDLLTEARVEERFPGLRSNLPALYAGYYVAELLGDGTQDYDPHPGLYELAIDTLRKLSAGGDFRALATVFELGWLDEIGLRPVLDRCAGCGKVDLPGGHVPFSSIAGGVMCVACSESQRDRRMVSREALSRLGDLARGEISPVTAEIRALMGGHVSSVLGRRPRLLNYLGS